MAQKTGSPTAANGRAPECCDLAGKLINSGNSENLAHVQAQWLAAHFAVAPAMAEHIARLAFGEAQP